MGIEGFVLAQDAPSDAGELVDQGDRELVPVQSSSDAVLSHAPKLYRGQLRGRIRSTFAAWIISARRYLLPRLEMRPRTERPSVLLLSRHQAEPGTEIAPALKSLAAADRGDKTGRDHWPDARHGHQPLAFSLDAAEFFDLTSDGVNALVQVTPIFVKIEDQPGHARRYLVLAVLQYREKRRAKGARAGPDGNALLDEKSADLVDRRCPAGDQSGPDAVKRLQVSWSWLFSWTKRRFGRNAASAMASASL